MEIPRRPCRTPRLPGTRAEDAPSSVFFYYQPGSTILEGTRGCVIEIPSTSWQLSPRSGLGLRKPSGQRCRDLLSSHRRGRSGRKGPKSPAARSDKLCQPQGAQQKLAIFPRLARGSTCHPRFLWDDLTAFFDHGSRGERVPSCKTIPGVFPKIRLDGLNHDEFL